MGERSTKSPFPGLDPYLEMNWGDVHTSIIAAAVATLNGILPDDLVARAEERLAVVSNPCEDLDEQRVQAGVRISQLDDEHEEQGELAVAATAGGVARPVILQALTEPGVQRYVEIQDARGGQTVTVIELLSPSNKRGRGMDEYVRKRSELFSADVHVVEIDLVRKGNWRQLLLPYAIPGRYHTPYRVIVWRAGDRGRVELYPI